MSEQDFGSTPPPPESSTETAWGSTQPPYTPPVYGAPPPPAAAPGLSETAASTLAYVTFIPAIIFLLVPPYNASAKIRFHAIQELGLSVAWFALSIIWIIPILGWLIGVLGSLCLLVVWILCIVKASQGGVFKIPILGDFAAKQSGYVI